jgi:hypothetical protein
MENTTTVAPASTTTTPAAPITTEAAEIKPVNVEAGKTETPPEGGKVTGEIKKETNPDNPDKPYKIKVDGKEYNVGLEEALKLAQKGVGADKKFNEAFRLKQQAEQFIHQLKTDPMSILMNPNLGFDFKKMAQDYLAKEIEKEMMTPEQRELYDTKEKLRQIEDEKKQGEEKASQERMQQLVSHYSTEYEKDIQSALQTSGLPKTRGTVKRIAYYMQKGLERGVELKAGDVIDLVRTDYIQEHNELYGSTDGDTLIKMFGDQTLKKLMEANLKKMKGGGNLTPPPTSKKSDPEILSVPTKKMDKDEWRAELDKHVAGL